VLFYTCSASLTAAARAVAGRGRLG